MLKRKREIADAQSRPAADERKTGVTQAHICRRYPIGAELIGANETHFRVWAPKARRVDLVLEESAAKNARRTFHPLEREEGSYFSGTANAAAGSLYRFRIDNNPEHFHPDPASRFQPHGPHGSSCVVDPTHFNWSDANWRGVKMKGRSFTRCIPARSPRKERGKQRPSSYRNWRRSGSPLLK